MDSDDNCLIIDESDTNLTLDDASPNLPAENDSSMNGTETPNNVSQHESDEVNSPKVSSTTHDENGTSKSKERRDDTAKPKTDRHKPNKHTSEKRTSSNRVRWVRMSRAAFTDNVLNVS